MKKVLLSLMALVSLSQAQMYTGTEYQCKNISIKLIDSGSVARVGTTIMFNLKGGLYTGVTSDGTKAYMILYPKDDKIMIGLENQKGIMFKCKEAIKVAKGE